MRSTERAGRICLLTALPFESRPLLDRFHLKADQRFNGLRLYRQADLLLLETGSGKLAAAAAVAAMLQHESRIRFFLNIGIAGGTADIGCWHLASSVHDAGSGRRWYPHLPPARVSGRIPTIEVSTLDEPSDDYRENCVFDLELAGMVHAALHWRDTTSIQALKVVSDNPGATMHSLDKDRAKVLIASGLDIIESLVTWMRAQPQEHMDEQARISEWIDSCGYVKRLSQTEQRQLKRGLERYLALHGGALPEVVPGTNATAKVAIGKLLSASATPAGTVTGVATETVASVASRSAAMDSPPVNKP